MGRTRRTPVADTQSEPGSQPQPGTGTGGEFTCPECGRTFSRAAALGAHRRRAHGVAGTSANAKRATTRRPAGASTGRRAATRRRATAASRDATQENAPNRDALLAALFPNGVPPREDVIRAVGQWLDDADRLGAMR
jgi:C2H2 type zinc finger protein